MCPIAACLSCLTLDFNVKQYRVFRATRAQVGMRLALTGCMGPAASRNSPGDGRQSAFWPIPWLSFLSKNRGCQFQGETGTIGLPFSRCQTLVNTNLDGIKNQHRLTLQSREGRRTIVYATEQRLLFECSAGQMHVEIAGAAVQTL